MLVVAGSAIRAVPAASSRRPGAGRRRDTTSQLRPNQKISNVIAMAADSDDKLAFDTYVLGVYLTGLQSEVEAKLRRVNRFRVEMQKIDSDGVATNRDARERAARALVKQVEEMLESNLVVRETLQELLKAAQAVLRDVEST
jgi:hypothetical protein